MASLPVADTASLTGYPSWVHPQKIVAMSCLALCLIVTWIGLRTSDSRQAMLGVFLTPITLFVLGVTTPPEERGG